jgi:hypothetical protein
MRVARLTVFAGFNIKALANRITGGMPKLPITAGLDDQSLKKPEMFQ